LRLKSLEIQGFKSFPDKTLINFEDGITAIVGPNGSGKSNISDAIRWVLGEQSVKTLRGESKMEDVIFNGASGRRPLGFAEVSLTIDNSSGLLATEYSEVTVTRRLYRSGESEYRINRQQVRLRDVVELFMDTGIGRDGYSIIGQGRIAEIISTKDEDRRQIFEEAAGISKFRYRRAEAQRKLNSVADNLVRLNDIASELEARVEPLRIESEKAQKYLELRDKRRKLEVNLWLRNLKQCKLSLAKAQEDYSVAKAQLDSLSDAVSEGESELDAMYLEMQQLASQIESIREQMRRTSENVSETERNIAVLTTQKQRNGEELDRIADELTQADAKKQLLCQQLDDLMSSDEAIKNEIISCEKDLSDTTKQFMATENAAVFASKKLEGINGDIAKNNDTITKLRIEHASKQSYAEALKDRINSASLSATAYEEKLRDTDAQLSALQKEREEKKQLASTHGNILLGYEMKIKKKTERIEQQKRDIESKSAELSGLIQRISTLSDMQKQMEGFSFSVKNIMRASQRGQLDGIFGTVSQLISVTDEYVQAIETALGAASENIVVEDERAAKAGIQFLKAQNGGRATFLPLTSISERSFNERGIDKCKGYIGIAAELVSFDSKFSGIFGNLLGKTVIADNIDNAIAIAKQFSYRFRIVTLDGQVINAGGAMTGGSAVKTSGFISRDNQINELKLKQNELENTISEMKTALQTSSDELALINSDYIAEKEASEKKEKGILELDSEIRQIMFMRETLQRSYDEETTSRSALENELAGLSALQSEREAKIAEAENALTSLSASAQQAQSELDKAREVADSTKDAMQAVRLTLEGLKARAVSAAESIASQKQRIDEFDFELADKAAQIDELKLRNTELEAAIAELESSKATLSASSASDSDTVKQLSDKRDSIEKARNERSLELRGFSSQKENMVRETTRLENKMASAQHDYDSTASKLWDEYQLTYSSAEEYYEEIPNISAAQKQVSEMKSAMKALGNVNVNAVEEYKQVSERYEFMSAQISDLESSRDELMKIISELTSRMSLIFAEQFAIINEEFKKSFTTLFGGGSAELVLASPEDVLSSGIEIKVQPPGKIIKNLSALSGGEQAFVAIAILFAMLKVRPTPFCVLDEVESALDDVNINRFADYVRNLCTNTQFITITHRRGTMRAADILYGITMQEKGISKVLTINVTEAAKTAGVS